MRSIFLVLCCLLLTGCEGITHYYTYPKSQYRKLDMAELSIGMDMEAVNKTLGVPADVIGSKLYEGGHIVKVLQYLEAEFSFSVSDDRLKKDYYLYFLDGQLVQWGRPGDWEPEADRIYEVRLK